MPTLKDIVTSVEEAAGKALLDRIANPDPHERDLPIRHPATAQIVAWVPESWAEGCRPVIRNGLVVSYSRVTKDGVFHPTAVKNGMVYMWSTSRWIGDEWLLNFNDDGTVGRGAWSRSVKPQ